jgi:hypothetical protein
MEEMKSEQEGNISEVESMLSKISINSNKHELDSKLDLDSRSSQSSFKEDESF